jgi:NAD(P) transhydrogenase subunit beta
VPYDQVFEMEDINGEFGQADVVHHAGRQRRGQPGGQDRNRRSTACPSSRPTRPHDHRQQALDGVGLCGWDNELFYMDQTMMVFGDAKKVVEDMVKAVE